LRFKTNPSESYQIILGARSAIFLPYSDLGVIIVDEEHETSFKQHDPAPRYHARDTAIMFGNLTNSKVLLGSATPSIESYYNARTGKYGLVELNYRHTGIELPEIIIGDLLRARKKRQMRSVLTFQLYEMITSALNNHEQVILFQNRRGYSPFVECAQCSWIPKCMRCDVSLTYHRSKNHLNCHYCGHTSQYPARCPECGSNDIKPRGFGTEKIESEIKPLFPNVRIDRMDLDSTRSKSAFNRIIGNVENRKTDILVGTQMVTKGLDFENVSLVGILNADNLINFPDFRAHERAFQLMSQVSGRAGRKHNRGKVVIQTSHPDQPLIQFIIDSNYKAFFKQQTEERYLFNYPPYFRLIKIMVKHKNMDTVNRAAESLANELTKIKEWMVLGPEFPLISRIQLLYNKEIWLKIERNSNLPTLKLLLKQSVETVRQQPANRTCSFLTDVDPG
jgi:primosomal protein N' (replication factor Y)